VASDQHVDADERSRAPGRQAIRRRWPLLAAPLLAALAGGLVIVLEETGGRQSALSSMPRGLDVLPFPGTLDASPQSQITVPALERSKLRSVSVRGTRSGSHSGRLIAQRGTAAVRALGCSGRVLGTSIAIHH